MYDTTHPHCTFIMSSILPWWQWQCQIYHFHQKAVMGLHSHVQNHWIHTCTCTKQWAQTGGQVGAIIPHSIPVWSWCGLSIAVRGRRVLNGCNHLPASHPSPHWSTGIQTSCCHRKQPGSSHAVTLLSLGTKGLREWKPGISSPESQLMGVGKTNTPGNGMWRNWYGSFSCLSLC